MDVTTEKKLRKKVIECCGETRRSDAFKFMSDSEYIGYQTGMIMTNTYNLAATMEEKYNMVKKLFEEGLL